MKTHGWIIEKNGKYMLPSGLTYTKLIKNAYIFETRCRARDCKNTGKITGFKEEHVLKVRLSEKGKPAEVIGKGD